MVKEKTAILFGEGLKGHRFPVTQWTGQIMVPMIEDILPFFSKLGVEYKDPVIVTKVYKLRGEPIDDKEAYYYYERTDLL